MTRTITAFTVLVLVVGGAVAPVAAAGADAAATTNGALAVDGELNQTDAENETDGTESEVTPGQRLAGVFEVQATEVEGEVESRTFGIRIARAATNGSKADVVAEQLNESKERLAAIQAEMETVREARENGTISEGEFRARMAGLAARAEVEKRIANETAAAAEGLPVELLAEKGVDADAILTLRENAESLTGPEVAEIARAIAGDHVGKAVAGDHPGQDHSDQERPGNGTERAQAAIEQAAAQIDTANESVERAGERVSSDSPAAEDLADAEEALARAEEALTKAEQALETGNAEEALSLAGEATEHAQDAIELARDAMSGADQGESDQGSDAGSDAGGDY